MEAAHARQACRYSESPESYHPAARPGLAPNPLGVDSSDRWGHLFLSLSRQRFARKSTRVRRAFSDARRRQTFKSIEAMAEAQLQALEAAQLAPPYALGGASFGGIVAWQMAQVLASKGHTPPLLVSIDSPAYGHLPPPMSDEAILAS